MRLLLPQFECSSRARVPAAAALVLLAALLLSSTAHAAARDRIMPHGPSAAAELESAITKEEAAIEALDRTPPQYFTAKQRLKEASQYVRYAYDDTAASEPDAHDLLGDVERLDLAATAYNRLLDPNVWSKAQVDKAVAKFQADIEKALALKKKALAILEHSAAASTPCVVGYPARVAEGESTISVTGCTKAPTEIDITLPSAVKKATNWGVESSKGSASGACTISGRSLECKLNAAMPKTSTFVVAITPAVVPLEVFQITLKFSNSSGKSVTFQSTVPKPEALHATATAAATTPVGSPAGTVFIVTLTVSAPIQQVAFDPIPGNSWYVAAVGGLSNMLACGRSGTQQFCVDQAHLTAPAGTYHIVLAFKGPVAAGTKISGHITAGPGPLRGFTVTLG